MRAGPDTVRRTRSIRSLCRPGPGERRTGDRGREHRAGGSRAQCPGGSSERAARRGDVVDDEHRCALHRSQCPQAGPETAVVGVEAGLRRTRRPDQARRDRRAGRAPDRAREQLAVVDTMGPDALRAGRRPRDRRRSAPARPRPLARLRLRSRRGTGARCGTWPGQRAHGPRLRTRSMLSTTREVREASRAAGQRGARAHPTQTSAPRRPQPGHRAGSIASSRSSTTARISMEANPTDAVRQPPPGGRGPATNDGTAAGRRRSRSRSRSRAEQE